MWGRVKVVVHHLPLRAPSQSIRTMSAYAKFKKSSTRPVRKRPIKLPEDLQPTMVKGKWRKPRLSGRVARQVKKKMIAAGEFWDPLWDCAGKVTIMKPPERLKQDAKRHARADEITKNLKKMPEIVEGYRKAKRDKKVSYRLRDLFDI